LSKKTHKRDLHKSPTKKAYSEYPIFDIFKHTHIQKEPPKETHKRGLQKRLTKEAYPGYPIFDKLKHTHKLNLTDGLAKRPIFIKRDLQKRLSPETYKKD